MRTLPCRATVIGFRTHDDIEDGAKSVRRSFECGYGAGAIADRWIARGYKRVSVYIVSASTGKHIDTITKTAA